MSKGLACAWERLTRASMSARKCYDRYELSGTEAVSLARARKQSVGRPSYLDLSRFSRADFLKTERGALFLRRNCDCCRAVVVRLPKFVSVLFYPLARPLRYGKINRRESGLLKCLGNRVLLPFEIVEVQDLHLAIQNGLINRDAPGNPVRVRVNIFIKTYRNTVFRVRGNASVGMVGKTEKHAIARKQLGDVSRYNR